VLIIYHSISYHNFSEIARKGVDNLQFFWYNLDIAEESRAHTVWGGIYVPAVEKILAIA
jgi:hypothetical protein